MHSNNAAVAQWSSTSINFRETKEGDNEFVTATVQDQDFLLFFSVQENEGKSNLIAITGDNSGDRNKLCEKQRK
jgi:hypothetical protein